MRKPSLPAMGRLSLAFGTALAVLGALGAFTFVSLNKVADRNSRVAHSYVVLEQLDQLFVSARDVESNLRAFALTGKYEFLEPYWRSAEQIMRDAESISQLTIDNPKQQARVPQLKNSIIAKLDISNDIILLRQEGRSALVQESITNGRSVELSGQIRDVLSDMKKEEQRLLDERQEELQHSTRQTGAMILLASLATAAVVWIAWRWAVKDLKERTEMQLALKDSEERLRLVARATQDAVWDLNLQNGEMWWNPGLGTLFGYTRDSLQTQARWKAERIHPADKERVREGLARATGENHRTHWSDEYRFRRDDGSYATVLDRCFVIRDSETGRATRLVGAMMDITLRRELEDQLILAREEAIEASRLKSEFLANMSHEIRTPMNGVIGMTGLLLDTPLSKEQRNFAETIRASGDALLVIINDILDFSKIEAGKLSLETMDFDLRTTLEGTLDVIAPDAHKKGLELTFQMDESVPRVLRGDAGRLRQIVMNLLSNAVKFTARGEVSLRVDLLRNEGREALIRFEVRDTGIGIAKSAQERLFQPFVQADGSTMRKFGGTGLGLAISRQLADLMGGRIGVQSDHGKGSTFWVEMRLEFSPEAALASSPEVSPNALQGCRVLIVDDNATNREILIRQLEKWGATSLAFALPMDALHELERARALGHGYDLAILDMMMPELDGLGLARRIHELEGAGAMKIILLTSMGQMGRTPELKEAGISACLAKPIKQARLLDCILHTLAGKGVEATTGALAQAPLSSSSATTEDDHVPLRNSGKDIRVLIAEDNAVNQRIAIAQLTKLGYAVDAVANGAEAVEALSRIPYDMILMDCQMPELDGYQATRQIRLKERMSHQRTCIIAMTANAMEGDREKCLEAGMDDHIAKPVKIDVLAATIERWLGESQPGEKGSHARI